MNSKNSGNASGGDLSLKEENANREYIKGLIT